MFINEDEKWMSHALDLAKHGYWYTETNPLVGAVLVKSGKVIGEGWHKKYGDVHAEVNAFRNCKENTEHATLYVTLEPCCHYGKTPPCLNLVLQKKVKRVVIAMKDPNPLVSGKSIKILKENGIQVIVGVLENEAVKLNEIFIKYITEHKPFVLYKAAMSIDGKTSCYTGDSKWISSETSRNDVHYLRNKYKAIMVGAGTIKKDNPSLTSRFYIINKKNGEKELMKNQRNPIRIIVDGKLSSPIDSKVFQDGGKTVVLTTSYADKKNVEKFKNKGIELIYSNLRNEGKVDLNKSLEILARKGINSILLEGGAETAAEAFNQKIVDKLRIYIAPIIIGGKTSPSIIGGSGVSKISDAIKLKNISINNLNEDTIFEAYTNW